MLPDSVSLNAEEDVVSDVAPVREDLRLLTPVIRPRAEKMPPSNFFTLPSRLVTSEEMSEMSFRTVLASRVFSGREYVRVEARRRTREVVKCIFGYG